MRITLAATAPKFDLVHLLPNVRKNHGRCSCRSAPPVSANRPSETPFAVGRPSPSRYCPVSVTPETDVRSVPGLTKLTIPEIGVEITNMKSEMG